MSANELWTPTRVKNFMRELKMKATKWDENIVALAEKGSMSVEEFLKTDPITFGEKIWGKSKNVYIYHPTRKILGDSIYREMLYYYQNTPVQIAAQAFMDAKVAAIKEQKALGLTTYMGVSAENKAGWEYVFAENKAAKAAAAEVTRAVAEEERAAVEKAARYAAAVEAMESKSHIVFNPEDEEHEEDDHEKKTEWTCDTCSAVWRTKTKTE